MAASEISYRSVNSNLIALRWLILLANPAPEGTFDKYLRNRQLPPFSRPGLHSQLEF
jgi:hypothetical protein